MTVIGLGRRIASVQTESEQKGYPTENIIDGEDHTSYRHKVETSTDGVHWLELYKRECTGWEFKPVTVDRAIRYLRLTIEGVSEGRAGVGEISLY